MSTTRCRMAVDPTRQALFKISENLEEAHLHSMKYLCQHHIKPAKMEKITTGIQLFNELEYLLLISPEGRCKKFSFVAELLFVIGRTDLLHYIDWTAADVHDVLIRHGIQLDIYRVLLHRVCQELESKALDSLKFLCTDWLSRRKAESIKSAEELLNELERQMKISRTDLEYLRTLFNNLQRNHLNRNITDFLAIQGSRDREVAWVLSGWGAGDNNVSSLETAATSLQCIHINDRSPQSANYVNTEINSCAPLSNGLEQLQSSHAELIYSREETGSLPCGQPFVRQTPTDNNHLTFSGQTLQSAAVDGQLVSGDAVQETIPAAAVSPSERSAAATLQPAAVINPELGAAANTQLAAADSQPHSALSSYASQVPITSSHLAGDAPDLSDTVFDSEPAAKSSVQQPAVVSLAVERTADAVRKIQPASSFSSDQLADGTVEQLYPSIDRLHRMCSSSSISSQQSVNGAVVDLITSASHELHAISSSSSVSSQQSAGTLEQTLAIMESFGAILAESVLQPDPGVSLLECRVPIQEQGSPSASSLHNVSRSFSVFSETSSEYTPDISRVNSANSESCNTSTSSSLTSPDSGCSYRIPSYPMTHTPRGRCVIINNINFHRDDNNSSSKKLRRRNGADVDGEAVAVLFDDLNFYVTLHTDVTSGDILRILTDMSRNEDHGSYDCFVCFIMSHGSFGAVYGSNGLPVDLKLLMKLFTVDNCKSLQDKPKIFVIQACQGNERALAPPPLVVEDNDDEIESDSEEDIDPGLVVPEHDFILCLCTIPGHRSQRNPMTGSLFITSVVRQIRQLKNE